MVSTRSGGVVVMVLVAGVIASSCFLRLVAVAGLLILGAKLAGL